MAISCFSEPSPAGHQSVSSSPCTFNSPVLSQIHVPEKDSLCLRWGSWMQCPGGSPAALPAHCPAPPGSALDCRHEVAEETNAAAGHTEHSNPRSWWRLPKPWRCLQPGPWVSARAIPTHLRKEKESPGDQTQAWSIPLPLNASKCLKNPRCSRFQDSTVEAKPLHSRRETLLFTIYLQVIFGLKFCS